MGCDGRTDEETDGETHFFIIYIIILVILINNIIIIKPPQWCSLVRVGLALYGMPGIESQTRQNAVENGVVLYNHISIPL